MQSTGKLSRTLVLFAFASAGAASCSKAEDSPGESGSGNATTSGSSGTAGSSTQAGSGGATTGGRGGTTSSGGASGSAGATGSGGTPGAAGTTAGTSAAGLAGGGAGATGGGSGDTGTDGAGGPGGDAGDTSAGGTAGSGGGSSVFPPSVTRPRIMIVGDSISAGPGCYKKYLVQNLTSNGITNYEFVGEYDDDCGGGVKHSAVSCTTSTNYTQASFMVTNCTGTTSYPGMATLVDAHDPDLVMIQLGVNDVWGGNAPIPPILANYATLVEQARAHNPNVVVMVAQIHKIITENCTNAASTTNAEALVMAVPDWAASISTPQSPVLVADLWTNSDPQEAEDCVHPDDAGAQRMGQNWFSALEGILH